MKKYISLFFLLSGCFAEKANDPIIVDASKDTSFVIEDHDSHHVFIKYNIEGQLDDSAKIEISYFKKAKGNENIKLDIPLQAGKVKIKDGIWDFYADKALFTFKHLNNKKGQLTIKASL
ncbi:MAG: hypothetical protein MUF58_13860 [Arcicella sp.]|jgi:hypothetical protein|nr:hypothetical protein [Arcicella sp.]